MAGRRRKFAPRHKCGKIIQPEAGERHPEMRDWGTVETQRHRAAVYGSAEPGDEVNPKELICQLAPLRKHMTQEQLWAAQSAIAAYRSYCVAIGMPRVSSNSLKDFIEGSRTDPMPDDARMHAVDRYKDMIAAVGRYSRRGVLEVQRLMDGRQHRDLSILLPALTALALHLGMFRKKAA